MVGDVPDNSASLCERDLAARERDWHNFPSINSALGDLADAAMAVKEENGVEKPPAAPATR